MMSTSFKRWILDDVYFFSSLLKRVKYNEDELNLSSKAPSSRLFMDIEEDKTVGK